MKARAAGRIGILQCYSQEKWPVQAKLQAQHVDAAHQGVLQFRCCWLVVLQKRDSTPVAFNKHFTRAFAGLAHDQMFDATGTG